MSAIEASRPSTPDRVTQARARAEGWLPAAVLALVAIVYAPSLAGDWIWDDVYQFRDNPAITRPGVLLTTDIWSPTGRGDPRNTPAYRPLAMLSHVPGQTFLRGPAIERVVNLALHLSIVAGVALLAAALGAGRRAAWLGAALLGCHPAAVEGVAWISSRGDLMGTALLVHGLLAVSREKPIAAGVCLAIAPFCKETYLLAPVAAGLWWIGSGRGSWRTLGIGASGGAAYLAIRSALDITVPAETMAVAPIDLLGAVGAVAARGAELLLVPTAADAVPPFALRPASGIATLVLGLAALAALPRRPWLAPILATLPMLALAAPASLANGLIADRYFYVAAAGLAVAAALGFNAWMASARPPSAIALLAIPLALAPFAAHRASDWTSAARLFDASLARNPDNARALFHRGHAHHAIDGNCTAAIPLYERAMNSEERAGNNLQACLITLGRLEEAAALGPEIARRDPFRATPALNTGRALAVLGRAEEAEPWVREALRRDPDSKRAHVLLGNVRGMQGDYAGALQHFERALAIAPDDPDARRGAAIAAHHLATPPASIAPVSEGRGAS